jgi:hypothetical protein
MSNRYDMGGGGMAARSGTTSAWHGRAPHAANTGAHGDSDNEADAGDIGEMGDTRAALGFAALAALQAVTGAAMPLDCAALALAAGRTLGHAGGIVAVQSAALGVVDGALYRSGANTWTLFHADSLNRADARFMTAFLLARYALHHGGGGGDAGGMSAGVFEIGAGALDALGADDGANARAYAFAARLLMPLDAFRAALAGSLDLELAARHAETHGLPVLHVVRRWLSYTADNAVLVLGEGGAMRAAWASETASGEGLAGALRVGGHQPLPDGLAEDRSGRLVDNARWFGNGIPAERVTEMTLYLDPDGMRTLTLLRLRAPARRAGAAWSNGGHGLAAR